MTTNGLITAAFRGRLGAFDLDAAFTVPARGVTALFGPSGCGKTTVLRCMAGLHRLASGSCIVDGEVWQQEADFRPPHTRAVGYVFQDASLFPHLSVRRNLLFGARSGPAASMDLGFEAIVALLGLGGLLDRSPRHLSGGERQRAAIGRALLSRPKLLLMDEPLSALDRRAKEEIMPFLERLHDRLALPTLYVTHDMAEVERLADHLVLMEAGRVVAAGPLQALQSDPLLPLATAREAAVSLDAIVERYEAADGLATMAVAGGRFLVPTPALGEGAPHRLRIAAGDVSLARQPPRDTTIINILPVRILAVRPSGPHEVTAVLGLGPDGAGGRLLSRVTRRSWDLLALRAGEDVYAQVKGVALAPGRGGTPDVRPADPRPA